LNRDVQISGTKTGYLVCTTFKIHETVRVSAGHDTGGKIFFVPSFQKEGTKKTFP